MKKKLITIFLGVTILSIMVSCNSDKKESAESTPVPTVEATTDSSDEIVVTDPLVCPPFTAEKNTSAMVDQIAFTAKDYAPNLSDDQANQIISAIREAGHKFYNGPEEMEKYMWYGYLLDYKYGDSDPRSALGTDLVQAIKYCYRNVELATDESTQLNLEQVDKDLSQIQ